MGDQGVSTYLLLIDPDSLTVLWANDNVENRVVERTGASAVGVNISDVIAFADALSIPDKLRGVAARGKASHVHSMGFSLEGSSTTTSGSMYRLPSGELLLASEYVVAGIAR